MGFDRTLRWLTIFFCVAVFAHVAGAAVLDRVLKTVEPVFKARKASVVDLEQPPPPPPPQVNIPEPPAPEPPRPQIIHHIAAHEPPPPPTPPPPPPPAPTRAAPLMVVDDEYSNDQDTVAVGDNVNATGDTSNNGVLRGPGEGVRGAQLGGTGNGGRAPTHAAPPPEPTVDYSTHAHFECDEDGARAEFPDEAREQGISEMDVRLRVSLDANGHVLRISALNDPGYGFVTAAERTFRNHCRVTSARDRAGAAVADVQTFHVHFVME